ncbi:Ig-like domain-containing protein [Bacillus sp. D386]|uniref:Ig-like domain-containing protein n=1 Tax=Bacillus sp. D386 TaxID=2587155 RepID=UPI00112224B3|nr:Ig-like domain-containing protein [Bacillus sp. D386]
MHFKNTKNVVFVLLSLVLLLSNLLIGIGTASANTYENSKLKPFSNTVKKKLDVSKYDPDEKVRVIVELEGTPAIDYATKQGVMFKELSKSKQSELQANVKDQQSDFLSSINKKRVKFDVENSFTVVANGVSGEVKASDISKIESISTVSFVYIANEYKRPEVKPEMVSSGDIVEAEETWVKGYNGTGTVVGIIDTGIDPSHKDMVLTDESKAKLTKSDVDASISKNKLPGKYHTAKVPYGYNYYDKNQEILDLGSDASMHGMHVGGTVGANGSKDAGGIKGIAPETQLLALKVFGNDSEMPSTWGDIYVKAIDDAILLGADVLNMSLGSTAGFQSPEDPEQKAIERAVNNGVLMAISAGNSAQISDGYADPFATNPDIGLVGSPSVSKDSISVASLENTHVFVDKFEFTIGGTTYSAGYKTQSSPLPLDVFGTTEKDVVYVGNGHPDQYQGKDVAGKIVFAVRTAATPNYGEIQKQAEAAGAIGVIIRGTPAHGDFVSMALNSPTIPLVSLRVSDGTMFEEKIKAAGDVGKVKFTGEMIQLENGTAGQLSTFTSWGVTPNLDFKPEITAPGGKIYSTLNDDKYGVMSGTSMAAPHVAGGSALVLEYVEKNFPNLEGKDKVQRAKTLLMNTSETIKDPLGTTYYSPRRQGAGVMKLNSAITSPVYVVNKGTDDGKVTLKEISNDKFSFTLTATNFSEKDATYTVDTTVLSDALYEAGGYTFNDLTPQEIKKAIVTSDSEITVAAGKSKDFTITIDLKNAKADLEKAMKNGYFVEGFVFLKAKNLEDSLPTLSIPFVGFKGDWNKPNIIDPMNNSVDSFYGYTGLADSNTGEFLGVSPFDKNQIVDPSKIAFSPNADGHYDAVAPALSFLRNSKTVEYSITDTDGKTLRKITTDKYQRKNYAADSIVTFEPYFTEWDGKVNNKSVEEGLYYYQVKAIIDYEGKEPQVFKMPILVDNTEPTVSDLKYDDATKTVTFKAEDTNSGAGLQYIELSVNGKALKDYVAPNSTNTYSVKLSDLKYSDDTPVEVKNGDNINVVAHDYAGNRGAKSLLDKTIPYISVIEPAPLGIYNELEVFVFGYITDDSEIDYVWAEYEGKRQNLIIELDEETKEPYFFDIFEFSKEGKHDIRFYGADVAGNKIDFNREIFIDTKKPTIEVDYKAFSTGDSQKVKVKVGDNYNALRLVVNGNEEINTFNDLGDLPVYAPYSVTQEIELPLAEGVNEYEFVLEDIAGYQVKKKIEINKVPIPVKPSVNAVTDASTKITGTAPTDSKVTITDKKNLTLTTTANDGKFSIDLKTKLKAGTKLYATVTDPKTGLVSEVTTITVTDKTAPSAPSVNAVSDKSTTVTGKTEAGAKVTVKAGSKTLGTATANSNGNYTVKIKKQKAGTSLSVTASDKAGNISKAKTVKVADKTAPSAPSVNAVSDKSTTVTGKTEAGAKVTVKAGSKTLGTATANSKGNYTVKIKKQKAGTSLSVTAKDKAGNTSKAKTIKVVDKTAPSTPSVNPVKSSSTKVTGKTEAGAKVTVKAGSKTLSTATANSKGNYTVKIKKQKAGTTLSVTAKDKAGNTSKAKTVKVKK